MASKNRNGVNYPKSFMKWMKRKKKKKMRNTQIHKAITEQKYNDAERQL